MDNSANGRLRFSGGLLLAALLLGGCSGKLSLPWEEALLDPGRIATREPLEIPPDLNRLPTEGARPDADSPASAWIEPTVTDDGQSSIDIPLVVPEQADDAALSRDEKEELPSWMDTPVEDR